MDRYPDFTHGFPTIPTTGRAAFNYRSGAYHNKPKATGQLSPIMPGPMKAFLKGYYTVSLGVAYLTHFKRSNVDPRLIVQRALECERAHKDPQETMGVWYHIEAGTWAMVPKTFAVWLKANRKQVTCQFEIAEYDALVSTLKRRTK